MVAIWWVVGAFIAGGYAGAILVGLLSINGAQEEPRADVLETLEPLDDATPRLSY